MFDVDLGQGFKGYNADGNCPTAGPKRTRFDGRQRRRRRVQGEGLVCVWKHYDKPSGLVYYVADGYDGFCASPAAPDVFVEDFWPVYALTFNDVEKRGRAVPAVRRLADARHADGVQPLGRASASTAGGAAAVGLRERRARR
jgi:hypothetical protein